MSGYEIGKQDKYDEYETRTLAETRGNASVSGQGDYGEHDTTITTSPRSLNDKIETSTATEASARGNDSTEESKASLSGTISYIN